MQVVAGDGTVLKKNVGWHGSVDSVFAHAVNMWVRMPNAGSRELVTLLGPGGGRDPFAMVTDCKGFLAQGVCAGQEVRMGPGGLQVGGLVFGVGQAAVYKVAPARGTADGAYLGQNLQTARAVLAEKKPRGLPGHAAFLQQRLCVLGSLRQAQTAGVRREVEKLLGLGPGLTPSGDDWLCGLLLAAGQPGSDLQAVQPALKQALQTTEERTTALSAVMLRRAQRLLAPENAQKALLALLCGEDVRSALAGLLQAGASSGWDTALGLCDGLTLGFGFAGGIPATAL